MQPFLNHLKEIQIINHTISCGRCNQQLIVIRNSAIKNRLIYFMYKFLISSFDVLPILSPVFAHYKANLLLLWNLFAQTSS